MKYLRWIFGKNNTIQRKLFVYDKTAEVNTPNNNTNVFYNIILYHHSSHNIKILTYPSVHKIIILIFRCVCN